VVIIFVGVAGLAIASAQNDSPADVLITTDLANLWRADEAGLLGGVDPPTLRANIPPGLETSS
jgi:iron(III) transport system substrate-binding protein